MLRELKTLNPKHELEFMFENCGNLLHGFVDFIIEKMEKRDEKA